MLLTADYRIGPVVSILGDNVAKYEDMQCVWSLAKIENKFDWK
jgi:hypothetical protein